jgi:hypothetical protein
MLCYCSETIDSKHATLERGRRWSLNTSQLQNVFGGRGAATGHMSHGRTFVCSDLHLEHSTRQLLQDRFKALSALLQHSVLLVLFEGNSRIARKRCGNS